MTEPWVSVEQIAEHLGVTHDSICRWIDRKHLSSATAVEQLLERVLRQPGAILAVEYKGADRWNGAEDDRLIGSLWATTCRKAVAGL